MKRKVLIMLLGLSISLAGPVTIRAETPTENYLAYEQYRSTIPGMCEEIGEKYNICPELLEAIIERESGGNPKAENGDCKGLMQVSVRWHKDRMKKLGVSDIYDSYSNILVAADYLSELHQIGIDTGRGDDIVYALLRYSLRTDTANRYYDQGKITAYVRDVLRRAEELEEIHGKKKAPGSDGTEA